MLCVLKMATDDDILETKLSRGWGIPDREYNWNEIQTGNLRMPKDSKIVVIAHGNNDEIGNKDPGTVDITGELFLYYIVINMENGSFPSNIYLSTCGEKIPGFAKRVYDLANDNTIWKNTRIFGHKEEVSGDVPPENDPRWIEIDQLTTPD